MKRQFDLYEYLEKQKKQEQVGILKESGFFDGYEEFFNLCEEVHEELSSQYKLKAQDMDIITIQRRAIMGHQKEIDFYIDKIRDVILSKKRISVDVPPWYKSLEDGIFAELFGFSGMTPWIYDEKEQYGYSTSAKIIGENIYFLLDGKCLIQPQKIKRERFEQLKRALLLGYPKERLERGVHEVYLNNGIRVTIFSGDLIKPGQDIMVFRKYVLKSLSFENLAMLGSIPSNCIPFLTHLVRGGFNILISGPVRSGKTTFLQTWQSYEDKGLEGVSIATDTETDWKSIMGDAPFMQLVADGNHMESVIRPLLRGDNDYIILEEMRDATAFNFALDITSIGTRRTKATIHSSRPLDISYRMARKIAHKYGGEINDIVGQIHRNFHYIFQMGTVDNEPGKKVLESITELWYTPEDNKAYGRTICSYDYQKATWCWSNRSKVIEIESDLIGHDMVEKISKELVFLNQLSPLKEDEPKIM